LFPVGDEAIRLPDLKFVALPHERDAVGDAGVGLERLAQADPAVLVHFQDLALADQCRRQVLVVFRKRLEVLEAGADRGPQPISAVVRAGNEAPSGMSWDTMGYHGPSNHEPGI